MKPVSASAAYFVSAAVGEHAFQQECKKVVQQFMDFVHNHKRLEISLYKLFILHMHR